MIIQTISMKSITAEGLGTLSVFEGGHDVPFDIKRIYYIYGAPQGTQRGGHAHKALRQVLWCPYGSILSSWMTATRRATCCWTTPPRV